MKLKIMTIVAALACSTAFAQAPASTTPRTAQENNAARSGGTPAAKAEMKVDAKKDAAPMASAGTTATMGNRAMDLNGDGMISRREWNSYHGKMWGGMKSNKGMVPWAEVEARMKGGPN